MHTHLLRKMATYFVSKTSSFKSFPSRVSPPLIPPSHPPILRIFHGQIWLYDGVTGQPLSTLGDQAAAHAGSIYALAWSPDSATLVTASADKTCKLWDVETGACKHTWKFGAAVGDMQVALVFCGDQAVSVSLNGNLNLLNVGSEGPTTVYQAHQGAITAMATSPVPVPGVASQRLITGSFTGVLCAWDPATGLAQRCTGGKATPVNGACHGNKVTGIAACSAGVVSVGWDDTLRLVPAGADAAVFSESVATTGQPCGVAANVTSDLVAVATSQAVMLLRGVAPVFGLSAMYTPSSIAMAPGGNEVAVGAKEGSIHIYEIVGDELKESKVVAGHRGEVSRSNDGQGGTGRTNRCSKYCTVQTPAY